MITYLTLILGFLVPHFAVNMNPCNAIKKNWENVIKFPMPGSCLKKKKKIHICITTDFIAD